MSSCSSSSPPDLGSSQSHSSSARPLSTLPAPSLTLSLLQTPHLQPSFLLALNPSELAFLPRPCFPLQTPIPACSCSPPRPLPWSAGGLLLPPWMVWKGGRWGKTLDMKRASRPAESVWDLGGSGLPGKRSQTIRDGKQLWKLGGGERCT